MKNILSLFLLSILLWSCEDKVNIDLENASPKLVIDANILWNKGTSGATQSIKISTTGNYYSNTTPKVSGAIVTVTSGANVFNFLEVIPNSGEYVCTNFVPVVNQNYTLNVNYQGQNYTATEKLLATPTITHVEKTVVSVFGKDVIQLKAFFNDNGNENNFYLVGVKNPLYQIPEYGVLKDEFFQGNEMFGFYADENLVIGLDMKFTIQGISERYYNYMNKLLSVSGNSGGSPFATPPASVRGNIVNQNDTNNYPLGYFHISEQDTKNYIIP
ncbi:DUF4249 domain-containing protein [Flavobacterium croceum]|uniref:DUF4249 domain-containing protein n=1 Tax=Flavobacterium croceum TaxID=370975 RepID=UPI0024A9F618|nr:DUF4249 domain-containing protein [Flavobacterium croceum]